MHRACQGRVKGRPGRDETDGEERLRRGEELQERRDEQLNDIRMASIGRKKANHEGWKAGLEGTKRTERKDKDSELRGRRNEGVNDSNRQTISGW